MGRVVTVDELASRLTEVLDRVREGERFVVERDGVRVAELVPPDEPPGITARELIERIGNLPMPGDRFADDLEAIQADQRPVGPVEWPT